MISINYKNNTYINADYILLNAPIYSKGLRSTRELIKKKCVEDVNYIFAREKNNEWIITDGKSAKVDMIFIDKTIINTIPELNNDDKIIDDNGIEKAPKIIRLNDNEKFHDEDGNIIEILTRGEREYDKIYFRVKDVASSFNILRLQDIVLDKNTKYIMNTHYKYFISKKHNDINTGSINNDRIKIKKELYLTYKGFQRLIFLSKNACIKNNLYTMKKWLDNFDKKILNNYKVNIEDNIERNNTGYVYIVSSNLLNAVKIGMWRSNIESLYSRYITCYGNNIHIDYFLTNNVRELESKTHAYFKTYKITNELFDKNYCNKYIEFVKNNVVLSSINIIDNDNILENNYSYVEDENLPNENTEKLFTLQIGTTEQKEKLVGSILGVNAKVIKEIFNADRNTLPCVYLYTLNTVKELRTSIDISSEHNDDSIVAKFGFTKDLSRRTGEHIAKYNKIQNVDLKLKYYAYVDPQYMSNAESDIKNIMVAFKSKCEFENDDELVIIPKDLMEIVERHYELIGKNYMGHISELVTKIKELEKENDNQLLNHRLEIQTINHENEKLLLNHQIEILKINNELELLKQKHEEQLLKVTNDKKLKDIQDKF
jgi:hypothetical protein